MRMLKMISGMVWPLRVSSRLLGRLFAAIRPTMLVTRVCYVLLGIALLLGALCFEEVRDVFILQTLSIGVYATAMAVVGVIFLLPLLILYPSLAAIRGPLRIKNVAKQPSATRTRASYVLLGIILLLGALGAEQDGQRGYAIALSMAGATLLLLRRVPSAQDDVAKHNSDGAIPFGIPVAKPAPVAEPALSQTALSQSGGKAQMPSDLLKSGWTRKGVAANKQGGPVLSDDPSAATWSLCGAVNTVFEPESAEWKSYMRALRALVGHNLVRWNGDSGRTQQEVVAVALKAETNLCG